jgi:hypothetical protein
MKCATSGVCDDFFTHLHAEKAMANVRVYPGPAGIEPATAQAQQMGAGQWRVTTAAPVGGRWTLALGILISDFDQIGIEAPILIK